MNASAANGVVSIIRNKQFSNLDETRQSNQIDVSERGSRIKNQLQWVDR